MRDNNVQHAATPTETLTGTVARLYCARPGFSAGVLSADMGGTGLVTADVKFRVRAALYEGQVVTLQGEWVEHPKFGRQFDGEIAAPSIPIDAEGLALWIERNPAIVGIGRVRARRIVDAIGVERFDVVLRESPDEVAALGVPREAVDCLIEAWEDMAFGPLVTQLLGLGLNRREAAAIARVFAGNTMTVLSEDPYRIVGCVAGVGFKTVDKLATTALGVPRDHPARMRAAIVYVLDPDTGGNDDGHVWFEEREALRAAEKVLRLDTEAQLHALETQVDVAATEQRIVRLQVDESRVALPALFDAERVIAQCAVDKREEPVLCDDAAAFQRYVVASDLTPEQQAAARLALTTFHRLCAITGPAGAGKTTTIDAIVRAAKSSGSKVALCALAGKAARRLEEATGCPASTIHRLLGYNGTSFQVERVEADLVVLDEASMVDSSLLADLIRRLDDAASLVLVGDPFQLPPVGAGAPFRDLIRRDGIPVARLTAVHRHAGVLRDNCFTLLDARIAPSTADASEPDEWPAWAWVRLPDRELIVQQVLKALRERRFLISTGPAGAASHRRPVEVARDVVVLTYRAKRASNRALDLSAAGLNPLIQRLVHVDLGGRDPWDFDAEADAMSRRAGTAYFPGDRVVQLVNDYSRNLYNGTTGRVAAWDEDRLTVEWETGAVHEVAPGTKPWRNIRLAYAMSAHRAQGSEYPIVIAAFHRADARFLNREIVYTAATRARQSCVLISDDWVLTRHALRATSAQRRTLLPYFLAAEARTEPPTKPTRTSHAASAVDGPARLL